MSGASGGSGIGPNEAPPRLDEIDTQPQNPRAFANAVAGLEAGAQSVAGAAMGVHGTGIGTESGQMDAVRDPQPMSSSAPEIHVAEAGVGLQSVQSRMAVTSLPDRASGAAEAPGAQTQAAQSGAGLPTAGASGTQAATQPASPMPVAPALDASPPGATTVQAPSPPPNFAAPAAMAQVLLATGYAAPVATTELSAPMRKTPSATGVSGRTATAASLSAGLAVARGVGQPLQMAYGLSDQAGGLLADERGDAAARQPAAPNPNSGGGNPWTDRGNPLLAWALSGVLGASVGAPLWERMGLSPPALIARLQERPWEVLSWHLGRAISAAEFRTLAALPGPFGTLLRAGIEPRAALTVQGGWEAALLGGSDPFSGRALPALWQSWGLGTPANLAMLTQALLGGAAPVLPDSAVRTSQQVQRALGIRPAAPPSLTVDPVMLLLGAGRAGILSGTGLAGLQPVAADRDAPAASGLAAVRLPSGLPLLLARQAAGGLPGIADRSDRLVLGNGLMMASATSGPLPYVAASLAGAQSLPSVGLLQILLGILPAAPMPLREAELLFPLDGAAKGGVSGRVQTDNGSDLVVAPRSSAMFAARPEAIGSRRRSVLIRIAGARAAPHRNGWNGPHVVHEEAVPVAIDLAPAVAEAPCWRIDDTRTLVEIGAAGPQQAAQHAAALYRRLAEGGNALALPEPGEGFSTWEGSPLWLSLAGIDKPARLGVLLSETQPGRVEVLRTREGEWLVSHAGGGWRAPLRHLHPVNAIDSEALLLDVLYGMPPEPEAAVQDMASRTAQQAFHDARTQAARARALPDRHSAWRSQEAWAAVARFWARSCMQGGGESGIAEAILTTLPATVADALPGPPLGRAALLAEAARGVRSALQRYGVGILAMVRRGSTEGIGPLEGIALAACLGRLSAAIAQNVPRRLAAPSPFASPVFSQPRTVELRR